MANHETIAPKEGTMVSTVVAIDRDRNSEHAVRWAVDNLRCKDGGIALVHVCIHRNPIHQDGERVVLSEVGLEHQLFLPFRGFCARKGIRPKEVILYDLDVAYALSEYISTNCIKTIVLGASNRGALARAFRTADVPTSVGRLAPNFCSVYLVSSKGREQLIKSAGGSVPPKIATSSVSHNAVSPDTSSSSISNHSQVSCWTVGSNVSFLDGANQQRQLQDRNLGKISREYQKITPTGKPSGNETPSHNSLNTSEWLDIFSGEKRHGAKSPNPDTCLVPKSFTSNCRSAGRTNALQQSAQYPNLRGRNLDALDALTNVSLVSSDYSDMQSYMSNISYEYLDRIRNSNSSWSSSSLQAADLEEELKRLKLELMQITGKYNAARCEAVIAGEKAMDAINWNSKEERKVEEAKRVREAALAMVQWEKQKCKVAVEIAQTAQWLAELESEKRKHVELMLRHEFEEKEKAIDALARAEAPCRRYSIDEIQAATNNFSCANKIGEGGYGPVYKGTLDHTHVAIKVLRSDIAECKAQFHQEVEVLSRMRHPNIIILLGTCPERNCLIYEYLENGSLENQLFCRNGTPSLAWRARFRIAAEIATGLNFLHQTKPQPLVHRDLKPDNILLDKNYVSKISDVGLSRVLPPSTDNTESQCYMTAAAGTFCYIDPEYQQSGMLGTKSDVYSLGIILLQIITAKPPIGLTHLVESSIEAGKFEEVLDPTVQDCPLDMALSFAWLALKCCELRGRDRPDLESVVLPALERLRDLGS